MIRPLVKLTSSRSCVISSQPACRSEGVMNLVQISRSLSCFLFMPKALFYGVFLGTHTGQGGPCPPTGKSAKTDYVYVMEFDGEKIRHMTKIWHAGLAMKELGWI